MAANQNQLPPMARRNGRALALLLAHDPLRMAYHHRYLAADWIFGIGSFINLLCIAYLCFIYENTAHRPEDWEDFK